ncbi:MAG: hypothetical protein ABW200_16870 [Hyphomicrobiaceae bacterium]|jgi:hypothetical protein
MQLGVTACVALGIIVIGDGTPARPAEAQQRITVVVPAVVRAQPAARTRLPIEINSPDAPARNSFLRIRGLPIAAALSDGHAIAPGSWAVPLNVLANLNVILPVGIQGSSDISIILVSVDGAILAEARTVLAVEVTPVAARPEPPTGAIAIAPRGDTVLAPPLPPEERERAVGMHTKGQELLERGQVYAARKLFERAAEIGLAQAAVSLAATYDPEELNKLRVMGLPPDPAAARKWYEKARELGAAEASDRLRRLGAVR